MAQSWMTPRDIYYERRNLEQEDKSDRLREEQEMQNLLLQMARLQQDTRNQSLYDAQNRMQFEAQLASMAANNAVNNAMQGMNFEQDLQYAQLRNLGMQGDIKRQEQSNIRFDRSNEQNVAGLRGREALSPLAVGKRLYGY